MMTSSPTVPPPPSPVGVPPAALPHYLVDQNPVMAGICFEAAYDTTGRVFIIRSENELSAFFDLADNSRLCRRDVQRGTLDFNNGRVLVGLWSEGFGCTAKHEVIAVQRNDEAKLLAITLEFITEGMCPYELVRPFWVSMDGVRDYAITVDVLTP